MKLIASDISTSALPDAVKRIAIAAAMAPPAARADVAFGAGLDRLAYLSPHGRLARGVIHEVLALPAHGCPRAFALLLARLVAENRAIVWSDPHHQIYPPALAQQGISLARLIILRPSRAVDEIWALGECLACPGVGAVLAMPERLSQVEARRLQLAARRGGGAGILMRVQNHAVNNYAAATRWLVEPAPGGDRVQRWSVQLIHGHGGRIGESIILEMNRENHQAQTPVSAHTTATNPGAINHAARA